MIKCVSSEDITSEIPKSRFIVLFSSEWSEETQELINNLKEFENVLPDIYCIDVEEFIEIAEKYNVYELPTIIIFNKGEIVERIGMLTLLSDIIDAIENA